MTGRFALRFFNRDVEKEYRSLDGSVRRLVDIGLAKLRVRADELGKPLHGELAGCKELKYREAGIRVVYRIVGEEVEIVEVVAIGARDKDKVFSSAAKRLGSPSGKDRR